MFKAYSGYNSFWVNTVANAFTFCKAVQIFTKMHLLELWFSVIWVKGAPKLLLILTYT